MTEQIALVAPNSTNTLMIPLEFIIDIHIDPDSPQAQDDVYSLLNEDSSVHQMRRIADDAVRGDEKLTLVFTSLRRGRRYSLEIDEGEEGKYFAFYQVLLEDLLALDQQPDSADDPEGSQAYPRDYDDLEWNTLFPESEETKLRRDNGETDPLVPSAYDPPAEEGRPDEKAGTLIL